MLRLESRNKLRVRWIDLAGGGSLLGGRRFRLTRRGSLFAQLNQAKQNFVAFRREFGNRARSSLVMHAVDELLLHVRREPRRAEGLPPRRHRAGELLKEVLDATRTAAEMVEHQIAHNTPAQTRA